jgi:hypothetical protein
MAKRNPTPRTIFMDLTDHEQALLARLKAATGIRTGAALVRWALFELARAKGVPVDVAEKTGTEAA